ITIDQAKLAVVDLKPEDVPARHEAAMEARLAALTQRAAACAFDEPVASIRFLFALGIGAVLGAVVGAQGPLNPIFGEPCLRYAPEGSRMIASFLPGAGRSTRPII